MKISGRRLDWVVKTLIEDVEPEFQRVSAMKSMGYQHNRRLEQQVQAAADIAATIPDSLIAVHDRLHRVMVASLSRYGYAHEVLHPNTIGSTCTCEKGMRGIVCAHQLCAAMAVSNLGIDKVKERYIRGEIGLAAQKPGLLSQQHQTQAAAQVVLDQTQMRQQLDQIWQQRCKPTVQQNSIAGSCAHQQGSPATAHILQQGTAARASSREQISHDSSTYYDNVIGCRGALDSLSWPTAGPPFRAEQPTSHHQLLEPSSFQQGAGSTAGMDPVGSLASKQFLPTGEKPTDVRRRSCLENPTHTSRARQKRPAPSPRKDEAATTAEFAVVYKKRGKTAAKTWDEQLNPTGTVGSGQRVMHSASQETAKFKQSRAAAPSRKRQKQATKKQQ